MGDPSQLVLIGAGGHALVVAEAAELEGWRLAGSLDDDESPVLGSGAPTAPRLGGLDAFDLIEDRSWIVSLGDVRARRAIIDRLRGRAHASRVQHPGALVAPTASIGEATFVGPGAIVHTRAIVEAHAILNSGCIIEHECRVGENAHVAPGSVLGGRVSVGRDTLIGLGARVLPRIRIGAGCTVGAGAVVTRDVADGLTVAGVPASPIVV